MHDVAVVRRRILVVDCCFILVDGLLRVVIDLIGVVSNLLIEVLFVRVDLILPLERRCGWLLHNE